MASRVAFGAMSLGKVTFYSNSGRSGDAQDIEVVLEALRAGQLVDTAPVYGAGESERVVGLALARWMSEGHARDSFRVSTKCGLDAHTFKCDASEAAIRQGLSESLERLQLEYVDVFFLHRVDPAHSIAQVAHTMRALIEEGKIRAWGLSEASAAQVREGHAVCPDMWLQTEYSLLSREVERAGILATCQELGIPFLAYSPLCRGMLTCALGQLDAGDWRVVGCPRFSEANLEHNKAAVAAVMRPIAEELGVAPAQVAVAWILRQKGVCALCGTRNAKRIAENGAAQDVALSDAHLAALETLETQVRGERYNEQGMQSVHQ